MFLISRAPNKYMILTTLLLLAGIALIGYGVWSLWPAYRATHNSAPQISKKIITHSTDTPDETKPTDACNSFHAETGYPERIAVPSLGIAGCIEQAGIDQHGAIAVPNNIYTAAWYVKSVLPGKPGLSVIDGHISGQYNVDGIFEHLNKLKAGDIVEVTQGGGKKLTYRVYNNQSVPLDKAAEVLLQKDAHTVSQLNLITCGGAYNKATKLYDHRIIVSAELQS